MQIEESFTKVHCTAIICQPETTGKFNFEDIFYHSIKEYQVSRNKFNKNLYYVTGKTLNNLMRRVKKKKPKFMGKYMLHSYRAEVSKLFPGRAQEEIFWPEGSHSLTSQLSHVTQEPP